jgi:hypothetical protein
MSGAATAVASGAAAAAVTNIFIRAVLRAMLPRAPTLTAAD